MTVDERRSDQKTVLDTKGRPSKRDLKTVFSEGNTENQSVCCFNEQKLLLLEKAEIFRRQNREKWEIRELERRIAHEQLLGIYKTHSKLEEYHAQQKKRAFEKRTREEQKENEVHFKTFVKAFSCRVRLQWSSKYGRLHALRERGPLNTCSKSSSFLAKELVFFLKVACVTKVLKTLFSRASVTTAQRKTCNYTLQHMFSF